MKYEELTPAACDKSYLPEETLLWTPSVHFKYERKMDGRRYLLHLVDEGVIVSSRKISKMTGKFMQQQKTMPQIQEWTPHVELANCIFDGEWHCNQTSNEAVTAMKNGTAEYTLYDMLFCNGMDIRQEPQWKRELLLKGKLQYFPKWANHIGGVNDPTEYRRLIKCKDNPKGTLEGFIRKNRFAPYGEGWDKIKPEDTWDVVIVGYTMATEGKYFENKWIKSVKVAQWTNVQKWQNSPRWIKTTSHLNGVHGPWHLVLVGNVSHMDEPIRIDVTKNFAKYEGQCLEVDAADRFGSGFLRHPRWKGLRTDKGAEECIWK